MKPSAPLVLAAAVLASTLAPTAAGAAPIAVTTTSDANPGGSCSLREAISSANSDAAVGGCPAGSGTDAIEVPAGTYYLTIPGFDDDNAGGDLDLTSNVTITGAGPGSTVIDADGPANGDTNDRVLQVTGAATVTLQDIGITGGHARPGSRGTDGSPGAPGAPGLAGGGSFGLTGQAGGHGGGILNQGALTLLGVVVFGNRAGDGGDGGDSGPGGTGGDATAPDGAGGRGGPTLGGFGGFGGFGGGIYSAGSLSLDGSSVHGNRAGAAGSGGQGAQGAKGGNGGASGTGGLGGHSHGGTGGLGGGGGGVFSLFGDVTMHDTSVHDNEAGAGGQGGAGVAAGAGGTGATGGEGAASRGGNGNFGGSGGGVLIDGGTFKATDLTVHENRAGDAGGGGAAGAAGDGGDGSSADGVPGDSRGGDAGSAGAGGGIRSGGEFELERITVTRNVTGAGGDGGGAGTGGAGGGSVGGAASSGGAGSGISAVAALGLVNATVAENESGPGGDGGDGGAGPATSTGGNGGSPGSMAIDSSFGHATVSHATVAYNAAGAHGVPGPAGTGADAEPGLGSQSSFVGVGVGGAAEGSVAIGNSIVVSLSGANCEPSNTVYEGHNLFYPAGPVSCGGDISAPPRIGAPTHNGGPTMTMALIPDSPAIDAADLASCPDIDQRGEERPNGAGCDLGAFEASVPAPGGDGGGAPTGVQVGGGGPAVVRGFAVATRRAIASSRGVVSLRVRCPAAALGTCRGRLTLTAKVRGSRTVKLGRAAFSVRAGRSKVVRLKLGRSGRRLLKKRGKLRAALAYSVTDWAGARAATGKGSLTIRVAKTRKRRRR